MMKLDPLSGLNVIITRPQQQAEALAKLISSKGGNVMLLPALEIKFLPSAAIPKLRLSSSRSHIDLAIFTSQNAVLGAVALLPTPLPFKVAAIGPGTAQALQGNHITVDMLPAERYDSEHLLALPFFEHIENKTIVIFSGKGGRVWLQEQLQLRGAKVIKIALYQRECPIVTANAIAQLTAVQRRIIIVTSGEALANLITIFRKHAKESWLFQSPMLVISQRLTKLAHSLGFNEKLLIQAPAATDLAILEHLIKWYANSLRTTEEGINHAGNT
jgi:uroporphyrinogen-III synthase